MTPLREQKRLVKEVSQVIKHHLGVLRSQVFDSLPDPGPLPPLQSLPLEDPSVFKSVQATIDMIAELREGLRLRLDQGKEREEKQKARILKIMENYQVFKGTFDQLTEKLLPTCRALLKIDADYLKRTLADNREAAEEAIAKGQLPSANLLNIGRCHEQVVAKIDKLLASVVISK